MVRKLLYLLFQQVRVSMLVMACLLNVFGTVVAYAADVSVSCDQTDPTRRSINIFRQTNDIPYYDDCEITCPSTGSSGASGGSEAPTGGTAAPGLTAQQTAFIDKYHDIAEKLSIQYGIPWETVMAQGLEESDAGNSTFAKDRNNFFGIGAFDSNPNAAKSFATPEEGWNGYYANIANTPTYRDHGVFQGQTVTDPVTYLQAIKNAGYASDPQYVAKNTKFVNAINDYAKTKGWDSSATLAQKHPEMLTNAEKNARGANASTGTDGSSGGAGGSSSSGCSGGGSLASGPIADVAKSMGEWGAQYQACYHWAGGHGDTADLDRRIAAHFNPKDENGVDCSGFTRAVIYKSTGTDPGPMTTDTMCADSAKFDHIPKAQAQPGDFAISCPEHVEVITGVNPDGSFQTVGSHTEGCGPGNGPSPSNYQGGESFVLRYKG